MSSIFDQLRKAAHAYYETAEPVMTDEEYDLLVEQARAADPTNAFFTQVGAVPVVGRVPLPCAMPSLKKIKPESIGSWKYVKQGPHVLSDKLDGISALWVCGLTRNPPCICAETVSWVRIVHTFPSISKGSRYSVSHPP